MAKNNDTGKLPEKQPHHRKPETRGRLIGTEPVKYNDGTIMKAYLVDTSEIKDIDFLKEKRMDSEAKVVMINNTDAIVLWWYAVQGMAYNNSTEISSAIISKTFGWGRKRVEEARNYLKEKELVKKISGNIYIINPFYASRISPVYRPALENAWRKGTVRYFDDDRSDIDKARKEKKKDAVSTPVLAVEPVREQFGTGSEQMLITDITGPELSPEEREKALVRQRNRERQRVCRERKRQAAREAAEIAAEIPVVKPYVNLRRPWDDVPAIPREQYTPEDEGEELAMPF